MREPQYVPHSLQHLLSHSNSNLHPHTNAHCTVYTAANEPRDGSEKKLN